MWISRSKVYFREVVSIVIQIKQVIDAKLISDITISDISIPLLSDCLYQS